MKALGRFLMAMVVVAVFGCIGVILFAGKAHSQVTDKPILKLPDLTSVTTDINIAERSACAVWWAADEDRFGDWHLSRSFCRGDGCLAFGTDLAKMIAARTQNVTTADLASCMTKVGQVPIPRWTVATTTSGKRPAYVLADGKRGVQSGTADTTMTSDGITVAMWCDCKVRSVETTTSTYCTWALAKQTFDPAEPVRVTLCRQSK